MTDHHAPHDPTPHDPVEDELGPTLHRLAQDAPAEVVVGGRQLVERRVRQRAARRRQAVGVGVAASVVALVGGVFALRSDPGTKVSLGAPSSKAAGAAPSVVTGYSTGSITGSPRGWTSKYDVDPASLDLPKVVVTLDASWNPSGISAQTTTQDKGTAALPMTVLADGTTFVVASVQPWTTLAPGKGKATTIDGRAAVIVRQTGDDEQLTFDVDATHRALVTAHGVDPDVLATLVGTLHQGSSSGGAWAMTPAVGSSLRSVATTPETSTQYRSISWERALQPVPGTTTSSVPPAVAAKLGLERETLDVAVQTGGAYEYYGQLAQQAVWAHLEPVSAATLNVKGVPLVSAMASQDGSSSQLIGLDAQGVVYTISHSAPTTGTPVGPALGAIDLATATDAQWSQLVLSAVTAMETSRSQAVDAKGAALGSTAPTTVPPVASTTTVAGN